MKKHTFTQEVIFHFTCASCANWWSYAASIDMAPYLWPSLTCPHCGHTAEVTEKQ
jgi:transcription elongation factor Elf1